MGGRAEKGIEVQNWPPKNELVFIQILHENVKAGKMQTSTFKQSVWDEIDKKLSEAIGEKYGVDKLKAKFNRLRTTHRQFSELIGHTGVTWNVSSNVVSAAEDVWQFFYTKHKGFRQFRKKGLENYELLGEIFNNTTATGSLHHASTQKPPNSDEEREMEEDFVKKGMHIKKRNLEEDGIEIEKDGELDNSLRRKVSGEFSYRSTKKESKLSKMDSCLDAWSMALATRAEANKAKMEKYKAQITNTTTDPYSIEACMDVLEAMNDLDDIYYNNVLEKIKDADWRKIFIKMPDKRRKPWIESLL